LLRPEPNAPDDAWLLSALALARRGAGDSLGALRAFDEALELAKAGSAPVLTRRLRAERLECRDGQALLPDEDDCLAASAEPVLPDADAYAVAGTRAIRTEPPWSAGPRSPGT
jgi:hypothetical protein